jgi:1-acyl-sn-glycerol-3-phosphate acyltransferase
VIEEMLAFLAGHGRADVPRPAGVTYPADVSGSYRPFLVGLASTAAASVEVLARSAVDRLGPADAERIIAQWRGRILRAGQVHLDVHGRDHIRPGTSYVVMSNHRSHIDIPTLFEAFGYPLRGVGKVELSRVPVWGSAMRKLGFVFVTRGDTQKAIRELEDAKGLLQHGISVFVAPEGTRSRDGSLRGFKKGGFHLAKALGVSIVPAWIEGAAQVMKPDSFRIHIGERVSVRFGAPIPSDGELDVLMKRVRDEMVALSRA